MNIPPEHGRVHMNEGNEIASSSAKLTVYKCPSCSGAVRFDATAVKHQRLRDSLRVFLSGNRG